MDGVDAERALCERYAARIRSYGLRHLRDRSAVGDLVQHVLLVVLQAVREGRVADPDRLDAYVLGTCRNAVMDMHRGSARRDRLARQVEVEAAPLAPIPRLPHAIDLRRVEDCLMGLDPRDRAVVLSTFIEERETAEIASALAISPGNVRVIRHRALAQLQSCVEGAPA